MDAPFPFGFPSPTAFYLTLYVATLVLHVVFMNYVLAGTAYLAVATWRRDSSASTALAPLLREWMPVMLTGAITAGVAPLLFLQILYQRQFYTANLLLFHRWMAILPVLIVGFYLLYLLRARGADHWPAWVRKSVGCGAALCFLFVAWSWTENHLLSLQPQAVWTQQYATSAVIFHSRELLPRLALWFAGAFPTLALCSGWQLWLTRAPQPVPAPVARHVATVALAGLAVAVICAVIYYAVLNQLPREAVTSRAALPYLILAAAGILIEAIAWTLQYVQSQLQRRWLLLCSFGLCLSLLGTAVVRETVRLSAIDIGTAGDAESLATQHAQAAKVGGFNVFLLFLILNTVPIIYCVALVRRRLWGPRAEM